MRPWQSGPRSRVVATTVGVLVLTLALAGCVGGSARVPTEAEIVGEWTCDDESSWGELGGTIEFLDDGTFVARGVPEGVLAGTERTTAVDGTGTWEISDGSFGDTPNYFTPGVSISFAIDATRVHHARLEVDGDDQSFGLRYWVDYDTVEFYRITRDEAASGG